MRAINNERMRPFTKRGSISPGDLEIQHKVNISIRQMHTMLNNLAKTLSSNLCVSLKMSPTYLHWPGSTRKLEDQQYPAEYKRQTLPRKPVCNVPWVLHDYKTLRMHWLWCQAVLGAQIHGGKSFAILILSIGCTYQLKACILGFLCCINI